MKEWFKIQKAKTIVNCNCVLLAVIIKTKLLDTRCFTSERGFKFICDRFKSFAVNYLYLVHAEVIPMTFETAETIDYINNAMPELKDMFL